MHRIQTNQKGLTMKLIALAVWAKKKGISERRARVLAAEGRLKGAQRIGKTWALPSNANYKQRKPWSQA
jgi:hypothetical protein